MKIFHTFEEAEKYADKNYFAGTYIIQETRNGNFRIIKDAKSESFADDLKSFEDGVLI